MLEAAAGGSAPEMNRVVIEISCYYSNSLPPK